ncbi:hypothetical protein SUGI_0366430 [Cryptomeria japonica]|nr:hypothetical protein SUGI_0366430 [Cryptomeria japonica]
MWMQGIWRRASPGKICMVERLASTPTPACGFLVCLYIPKSLSLKQRIMLVGFTSSIHSDSKALYRLSFEHPIQPRISLPYGLYGEMSYRCTKNNIAESLFKKRNSEAMGDLIRWHFFDYPWTKVGRSRNSFYILGRELSVHSTIAYSEYTSYGYNYGSESCILKEDQTTQEERPLLEVAALIKLQGIFPTLLKQFYPPKNFNLLIDRSVKVSIRSDITERDPLYFKPVDFHTAQILLSGQTAEAIPRKILEPVLNISSLCLATACIASQCVYFLRNAQAAAYISLAMVGTQAPGFGISLTTEIDHFYFASSDPPSKEQRYSCPMEEELSPMFDILINVLLLLKNK